MLNFGERQKIAREAPRTRLRVSHVHVFDCLTPKLEVTRSHRKRLENAKMLVR